MAEIIYGSVISTIFVLFDMSVLCPVMPSLNECFDGMLCLCREAWGFQKYGGITVTINLSVTHSKGVRRGDFDYGSTDIRTRSDD
jgi:hypothetical protein